MEKIDWYIIKLRAQVRLIVLKNNLGFHLSEEEIKTIERWHDHELFRGPGTASSAFLSQIVDGTAHEHALNLRAHRLQIDKTLQEKLPLIGSTKTADVLKKQQLESKIDALRFEEREVRNKLVSLITVEMNIRTATRSLWLSFFAVSVAGITLYYSWTSGAAQSKALDSSRVALENVARTVDFQTGLLKQQYDLSHAEFERARIERERKPEVKVYFWNFKKKVPLRPEAYDAATKSRRDSGAAAIDLKKSSDGRAYFDVYIENVGNADLVQAEFTLSCNAPFDTYNSGATDRSEPLPADPHSGSWKISFTKPLLKPIKDSGDGASYKFSVSRPFPIAVAPQKLFGCFVFINGPGLAPFSGGGFLRVVD
jgi:hypothetical protein